MENLIPITMEDDGRIAVSGRALHEFLEVKTRYSDWFERMKGYGFAENQDFGLVTQKRVTNNPKNPVTEIHDHALTLDMAKELSMIQRTDRGKQARQYFIAVEKEYNSPEKVMARALLMANKQLEVLNSENTLQKQRISELEPSALYCDKILKTKNAVPTSVIAKDFGWSPQRLNNYLQEKHVQYKVGETWVLYQEHCNKGYTKSFTFTYRTWAGDEESVVQTKWIQAGRKFIYELLKADGILPVIEAVV